jgi:hypothetical protein
VDDLQLLADGLEGILDDRIEVRSDDRPGRQERQVGDRAGP